jgi:hypothetical protein
MRPISGQMCEPVHRCLDFGNRCAIYEVGAPETPADARDRNRRREASRTGDLARLRPGAGALPQCHRPTQGFPSRRAAGALDGEADAPAADQVAVVSTVDYVLSVTDDSVPRSRISGKANRMCRPLRSRRSPSIRLKGSGRGMRQQPGDAPWAIEHPPPLIPSQHNSLHGGGAHGVSRRVWPTL